MRNLALGIPLIFAVLAASRPRCTEAFGTQSMGASSTKTRHTTTSLLAQNNPEVEPPASSSPKADPEEEEDRLSEADARLSDILPPAVSVSRNSVLFSEKPVTQRNNDVLDFWRGVKSTVPPVITGAWPWRDPYLADEHPMGAIYNIIFVRMPVIITGFIYAKNLHEGHPLIMDYGDGPFVVSPLIVFGVLALVLA